MTVELIESPDADDNVLGDMCAECGQFECVCEDESEAEG